MYVYVNLSLSLSLSDMGVFRGCFDALELQLVTNKAAKAMNEKVKACSTTLLVERAFYKIRSNKS